MPASTAQKLRIKEGYTLRIFHAPADFKKQLGDLPDGVTISDKAKTYDQVHWFVKTKAGVDAGANEVLALLKDGVVCWIYFPKGSSKIQTDLSRDKGWDTLMAQGDRWQWLSLISFNDEWSAFGLRLKTEADKRKEEKPKPTRAVFKYVNAAAKTVQLPDDFAAVLKGKPKTFFETLSFTNKKEYVEWIVSARREETRQTRVQQSVERLEKGWKNPANR